MKKTSRNALILVGVLIALTCVAMAWANRPGLIGSGGADPVIDPVTAADGLVSVSGKLTQDKVFSGGDGRVGLSLDLRAEDVIRPEIEDRRRADLVIVLDRSGSMQGRKLNDARQAVLTLLEHLSEKDRFALVSYSDGVQTHASLNLMTAGNRSRLSALVRGISAGGGTNLGAGLRQGIDLLLSRGATENSGKVILISDGIANQGITAPEALGAMASIATEKAFSVSTIGVGSDFNELLMTAIADRGSGNYHYLENPAAFAAIFQKEFHQAMSVAASSVKVRIPLSDGVTLVDASGYPIRMEGRNAVFFPGDLLSGRTKKLFLTFRVPADAEREFVISGVSVEYRHENQAHRVSLPDPFTIACVQDQTEALSSIDKDEWEQKVIFDDFNRLKEEVARDIKTGNQRQALQKIEAYAAEKEAVNATVQAPGVARNLEKDVGKLRDVVSETFAGSADEVREKQKRRSKSLQFEGYSGRRSK